MYKVNWIGFDCQELSKEFDTLELMMEFLEKSNVKPYVTNIYINGMKFIKVG